MPVTQDLLEELQAEYMADDVEIEPEMCDWSEAEARVFFEHFLKPTSKEELSKWLPSWDAAGITDGAGVVRLVCFHNAGSSSSLWTSTSKKNAEAASAYARNPFLATPNLDVMALELPGRGMRSKDEKFTSMDALSDALCKVLSPILAQPVPYLLLGHSMGCWIAYETWRKLKATGCVKPPVALVVNSFLPPSVPEAEWPWPRSSGDIEKELAGTLEEWKKGPPLWGTPAHLLEGDQKMLQEWVRPLMTHDMLIFDTYKYHLPPEAPPEKLPCWVVATHGTHDPMITENMVRRWEDISPEGKFMFRTMPTGDHLFMSDEELRGEWMKWLIMTMQVEMKCF